ncbi:MAG: apolipoprotein N-acyltransferase [Chlamydiota bacterium]
MKYLWLLAGFLITAFGQPAWYPQLSPAAAVAGYALMWLGLQGWYKLWQRFLIASLWFAAVQAVNLSWMTSTEVVGEAILGVYGLLIIIIGLQMGLTSLLIYRTHFRLIIIAQTLLAASLWVFMEQVRLKFFSGYTFSPVGHALTWHPYPLKVASLAGVYGLSWLVMAANVLTFHILASRRTPLLILIWLTVSGAPYGYGYLEHHYHLPRLEKSLKKPLSALLVQTALKPDQKCNYSGTCAHHVSPFEQWMRILGFVQEHHGEHFDMIVLPETTVPLGDYYPAYYHIPTREAFLQTFGNEVDHLLPAPAPPLGTEEGERFHLVAVSNAYWAQALANIFEADVIVGLEAREKKGASSYQSYASAYVFRPFDRGTGRYDKQILVPLVEYIPFEWAKAIAAKWGIHDFYEPGKQATVFTQGTVPYGISICYEETFGDLMRHNRLEGAQLLVNISNDGWYPNSRLPRQHFTLGRLRSVENGVPLLRSCNSGVTCAVDSLGQTVDLFAEGAEWEAGALAVTVPSYTYKTLYSRWGDKLIITISGMGAVVGGLIKTLLLRL